MNIPKIKIFSDKKYREDVKKEGKRRLIELYDNVTKKIPKKANALDKVIAEQLDRLNIDIEKWRLAVNSAEDIDNPDREAIIEFYKDFVDDYQIWSSMQIRINKAISGTFRMLDENGDKDEAETLKFMDPQGFPLAWFRDFMRITMEAKFYGYEAAQLGNIIDDRFAWVKKIPEENLIPFFHSMVKDAREPFIRSKTSSIDFTQEPWKTWIVTIGSETDLGLLNKCGPYFIYKKVFGAWSQHADLFGMPLRIGRTNVSDNKRKQNMIDMFQKMEGATFGVFHPDDSIEFIDQSGNTDPFNIYERLIEKCDQAISKIILSQTGTTDEKAFAGSANVHKSIFDDLIFSDKQDIATIVNNELIPRMKKLGMIAKDKKVFGAWDFSENITIKEWADIIAKLSLTYSIPADEVKKRIGLELDLRDLSETLPENKMIDIFNTTNEYYKHMVKNG